MESDVAVMKKREQRIYDITYMLHIYMPTKYYPVLSEEMLSAFVIRKLVHGTCWYLLANLIICGCIFSQCSLFVCGSLQINGCFLQMMHNLFW